MKKIEKPSKVGKPGAKEAAAEKAAEHAVDASRGPVNRAAQMSYAEAMVLYRRGELRKPVLTPEGWVCGMPAYGVKL